MLNLNLINAGTHGYETFSEDTAVTSAYTNVSTGGTANVAGAWVELIAVADFDANALSLVCITASIVNTGECIGFQISVGASGSEIAITDWIKIGNNPDFLQRYEVPINIEKGDRIAIRTIGNTFDNFRIHASLLTENRELAGLVNEDLMVDRTNHYDVVMVDPGATAHTKGSWSEIVASTTLDLKYLDITFSGITGRSGTSATWLYDVALGASGSEVSYISNLYAYAPAFNINPFPRINRIPVNIPAGSRISVRAQSDYVTATYRNIGVVMAGWGY